MESFSQENLISNKLDRPEDASYLSYIQVHLCHAVTAQGFVSARAATAYGITGPDSWCDRLEYFSLINWTSIKPEFARGGNLW